MPDTLAQRIEMANWLCLSEYTLQLEAMVELLGRIGDDHRDGVRNLFQAACRDAKRLFSDFPPIRRGDRPVADDYHPNSAFEKWTPTLQRQAELIRARWYIAIDRLRGFLGLPLPVHGAFDGFGMGIPRVMLENDDPNRAAAEMDALEFRTRFHLFYAFSVSLR